MALKKGKKEMKGYTVINVRLSSDLRRKLKIFQAIEDKPSMQQTVEGIIEQYFKDNPLPRGLDKR